MIFLITKLVILNRSLYIVSFTQDRLAQSVERLPKNPAISVRFSRCDILCILANKSHNLDFLSYSDKQSNWTESRL